MLPSPSPYSSPTGALVVLWHVYVPFQACQVNVKPICLPWNSQHRRCLASVKDSLTLSGWNLGKISFYTWKHVGKSVMSNVGHLLRLTSTIFICFWILITAVCACADSLSIIMIIASSCHKQRSIFYIFFSVQLSVELGYFQSCQMVAYHWM